MPPVAVNVVLAVHRSSCRKFHPCIFDCATYSCLAVSVDPIQGQCQVYRSPARFVSIENFFNLSIRELAVAPFAYLRAESSSPHDSWQMQLTISPLSDSIRKWLKLYKSMDKALTRILFLGCFPPSLPFISFLFLPSSPFPSLSLRREAASTNPAMEFGALLRSPAESRAKRRPQTHFGVFMDYTCRKRV